MTYLDKILSSFPFKKDSSRINSSRKESILGILIDEHTLVITEPERQSEAILSTNQNIAAIIVWDVWVYIKIYFTLCVMELQNKGIWKQGVSCTVKQSNQIVVTQFMTQFKNMSVIERGVKTIVQAFRRWYNISVHRFEGSHEAPDTTTLQNLQCISTSFPSYMWCEMWCEILASLRDWANVLLHIYLHCSPLL